MKELISTVLKVIVIILADTYTIFARNMNSISQQTYSQTSEYIGKIIYLVALGILFVLSLKLCDVEKKSYKIFILLVLIANIVYMIYSVRYYTVMTMGVAVTVTYIVDLIKIKKDY